VCSGIYWVSRGILTRAGGSAFSTVSVWKPLCRFLIASTNGLLMGSLVVFSPDGTKIFTVGMFTVEHVHLNFSGKNADQYYVCHPTEGDRYQLQCYPKTCSLVGVCHHKMT